MLSLSRRLLLRALPVSAAALALPAAVEAATPSTPAERLDAAIEALKVAAREVYPDITNFRVSTGSTEGCPMLVAAFAPEKPAQWDGPGIYEFALLDTLTSWGSPVQPVAFLDRAPKRHAAGEWFRWQHRHKGKFTGRGHYVPAHRVKIVRKVEALG